MIRKIILAAACCLPLGLFAQKGFTIHGKVSNLDAPAKAVLLYLNNDVKVYDSAVLHHGEFNLSGQLDVPGQVIIFLLRDAGSSIGKGEEFTSFYLDNSEHVTVIASDSMQHATVKGSALTEECLKLMEEEKPYTSRADSIAKLFREVTPEQQKNSDWMASHKSWIVSLQVLRHNIAKQMDSVKTAFMYAHASSDYSFILFKEIELSYGFNPDMAAASFARFPQSRRESLFGKKIQAAIDNVKHTGIGQMAADFTETDSAGKPVKLSDFRGHYVLLDFWASWCMPCREENPNYLKAYNKYKDKNFTILGVSLDDEKGRKAWLKAMKDDSLPWTQISALKGFGSKSALLYGLVAIPSNFLIDPDGKIIAKNLRGESLQNKLQEIFSM